MGTTGQPNLFKHEFELQGVFRADYLAGSRHRRHFTFVEFEGGEEHSLFGSGSTNQMRDWGRQIQHALGQIVDWSWALNDAQRSREAPGGEWRQKPRRKRIAKGTGR